MGNFKVNKSNGNREFRCCHNNYCTEIRSHACSCMKPSIILCGHFSIWLCAQFGLHLHASLFLLENPQPLKATSKAVVEILGDSVSGRSVWYYNEKKMFKL